MTDQGALRCIWCASPARYFVGFGRRLTVCGRHLASTVEGALMENPGLPVEVRLPSAAERVSAVAS